MCSILIVREGYFDFVKQALLLDIHFGLFRSFVVVTRCVHENV